MYTIEDYIQVKKHKLYLRKFGKIINMSFHVSLNVILIALSSPLLIITAPYSAYKLYKNINFIRKAKAEHVAMKDLMDSMKLQQISFIIPFLNPVMGIFIKQALHTSNLLASRGIMIPKSIEEIASIPQRLHSDVNFLKVKELNKYDKTDTNTIYLNTYKLSQFSRILFETMQLSKVIQKDSKYCERDIYINPHDLCKTTLFIGSMGSGKSVAIKNLFAQRMFNRALIFDVKGEYIEQFYRPIKDILFNIFDARSKVWDMFSDLEDNPALSDVIAQAVTEQLSEKGKDFWITAATKLLKDAINYALQENLGYQGILEFLEQYKEQAVKSDNKTELSIYVTLEQVIDIFKTLALLERHYLETEQYDKFFTINDFINSKDIDIYVSCDVLHQKAQLTIVNAFISSVFAMLLSRPDSSDYTFCLLDEFMSLKLPEQIETPLFTMSRSKAIQLIVATQFLPSDSNRERTKQLLLNTRHITCIFKTVEPKTLEILEQNLGTQEHIALQTTVSDSVTRSRPVMGRGIENAISNMFGSRQTTTSVSTSTQKQESKIISKPMIAFLPEYHAITIINNDIYLGKIDNFTYNIKAKTNNAFEPFDFKLLNNIKEANND